MLKMDLSAEYIAEIESTAVRAARRAGKLQMAQFRRPGMRHQRLLHDIKLETDRICEEAIVNTIRERFRDHAILTEEHCWLPGGGDAVWIVDPLDGTVNFWHGLPFFCVSIACYRAAPNVSRDNLNLEAPLVGAVLLPYTHELFTARVGQGAFFNGSRLASPVVERLSDAVVSVSFGKTPDTMAVMTRRLNTLLPQVRKARCLGAAAAELCYVAAGFLGGTLYEGLKMWDFAAARLILHEAGGFFQADETEPGNWRVLAGATDLIAPLRTICLSHLSVNNRID
jgi:fructose-1,6-bisphosphatase/inositol monophosphatase family enzyme